MPLWSRRPGNRLAVRGFSPPNWWPRWPQLSPATLYSYFGSKDALLAAAFDAALTDISNVILPLASVESLLEDGWESTARQLVRAVARGFSHDGRLVRLALTRLEESTEIQAVYTAHNQQVMEALARFVRLGATAGQLHNGDPAVLGRTALVLIQSLHNPVALAPGSGPVIDELASALYLLLAPIRRSRGRPSNDSLMMLAST